MNKILKYLFFALFVRPLIYIVIGLNVRNAAKVPSKGPAILVANHCSHIDTLILMSLFRLKTTLTIYPIAAKDYFLKTKLGSWFFTNIIEIIPINRNIDKFSHTHPFEKASQLLKNGNIIIIFPEGTRNNFDEIGEFKRGVAHLAKLNPNIPILPVYMHGPGMVLPKGEGLLVPYICDVYVGNEMFWNQNPDQFPERFKRKNSGIKKTAY